jgi:hypothetical protein
MSALSDVVTFTEDVFKTVNLALSNGLAADVIDAIGHVTGCVAERGLDISADAATLQAINKIVLDLVAAKTQVKAQPLTTVNGVV